MSKEKEIISNFNQRLQLIVDKIKIEKKELAEAGEVSASSITKYLKGISNPSQDVLALWAFRFDLNLNWLLTGEGEMLRSATGATEEVTALQAEVVSLYRKLDAMHEELHSAHKELLSMHRERGREEENDGAVATPAPGGSSAARSSRPDNE